MSHKSRLRRDESLCFSPLNFLMATRHLEPSWGPHCEQHSQPTSPERTAILWRLPSAHSSTHDVIIPYPRGITDMVHIQTRLTKPAPAAKGHPDWLSGQDDGEARRGTAMERERQLPQSETASNQPRSLTRSDLPTCKLLKSKGTNPWR